jgi:origin recognition complex subunit 1
MTRINFKPYTSEQLIEIVQKRLEYAQQGLQTTLPPYIDEDAIKFASKKVASISGDARRVLDICRSIVATFYEIQVSLINILGGP